MSVRSKVGSKHYDNQLFLKICLESIISTLSHYQIKIFFIISVGYNFNQKNELKFKMS